MNRIALMIALIFSALSLAGCDWPFQSPAREKPVQDSSNWIIVPASTSGSVMAVWRIDTKTGLMDFCFNNGGIQCNPPVYAPINNQKKLEKLKDDPLWQTMNAPKKP